MNNPQISIIIATYNSGKTINKALLSVKNQTFHNWECIIVDGSSKDNTIEIVKEYTNQDKRFRYVSEPDKGIYDAYNKGWKMALGQWIYYLGSDDWLTKTGLNELAGYLNTDAAILASYIYLYHIDGQICKSKAFNGKFAYHQGMIMKKEVIEALNGFDLSYKILSDSDLIAKSITAGYKVIVVEADPISYFTQGGTSSQIRTVIKVIKEKYRINKVYHYVKYPFFNIVWYSFCKLRSLIYRKLRSLFKK